MKRQLYLIGLTISLALLSTVAPTRKRLQTESDELRLLGCHTSLVEALTDPPTSPGPRS